MRACPKCGERYPDGAQYCPTDGSVLGPILEPAAAAPASDPRIGTLIERYRILQLLGTGGMGAVYRAEHTLIGRPVALKLLHPDLARDPNVVDRFFREARAANEIHSDHIVQVTDFGTTPDGAYLVMELLTGESLYDAIARAPVHRFHPERAVRIAKQVSEALGAAHIKGIIHRDLKPGNIVLIDRDDHPDFVKILDFGIAKLSEAGATQLTKTGMIMGSPAYMSPEQASGKGIDHRTDIYALGVILFEMLVGRPPFIGETATAILVAHVTTPPPPPRSLCPELPEDLQAVVLRCLAKSPADRPHTMIELGRLLTDWLDLHAGRIAVLPTVAQAPAAAAFGGAAAIPAGAVQQDMAMGATVATTPGNPPPLPPVLVPPMAPKAGAVTGPPSTEIASPSRAAAMSPGPAPSTGFGSPVALAPTRKLRTVHLVGIGAAVLGVVAGVVVTVLVLRGGREPSPPPTPKGGSVVVPVVPVAPAVPKTAIKKETKQETKTVAQVKTDVPEAKTGPASKEPAVEKEPPVEPERPKKIAKKKASKKAARKAAPAQPAASPSPPPPPPAPPPRRPAAPAQARNRYELDQLFRQGRIDSSQYRFQSEVLKRQMRTEIDAVHMQYRSRQISRREKVARIRDIRFRYGF